MMITLDQIEQLMNRTGAEYQTVRDALKATDGDMFQALLLIEEAMRKDASGSDSESAGPDDATTGEEGTKEEREPTASDLLDTLRKLLREFNATHVIIRKNGHTILNISATIGAIGLVLAPVAAVIGLGAAVVTDYELILELADGRELNVNQMAKDQLNDIQAGFETYTTRQKEKRDNARKDRKVSEEEGYSATYETEASEDAGDDEEPDEELTEEPVKRQAKPEPAPMGRSTSMDDANVGTGASGADDPDFVATAKMGGSSDDTGRTGYQDDPGWPDEDPQDSE